MTTNDIFTALVDINKELLNQCKAKMETLSPDRKTERKALNVELGIYNACLRAGSLYKTVSTWEELWNMRKNVAENMIYAYPKIGEVYFKANDNENQIIMAVTHSEMFIRNQLYEGYLSELDEATGANDTVKIFELQIKIGAMKSLFSAWEDWRTKNNLYPGMFEDVKKFNIKNSGFYHKAFDAMEQETLRLCHFTDSLDKDPAMKEKNMAEYKCAKYRYAGLLRIQVAFYQNYRLMCSLDNPDFLSSYLEDALARRPEFVEICEKADIRDKAETKWYYATLAYVDEAISEEAQKISAADDWEKIEVQQRIDGFRFAKQCLEDGWNER